MSSQHLLYISCGPTPSLAMLDQNWHDLNEDIYGQVPVDQVYCVTDAITRLNTYTPAGIFIADAGFLAGLTSDISAETLSMEQLVRKLVAYVKAGGNLVFGAIFAAVATRTEMDWVFGRFELGWEQAALSARDQGRKNPGADTLRRWEGTPHLPATYRERQLVLKVDSTRDLWYRLTTKGQSGVVHTIVERGTVGFVGLTECGPNARILILAMLQLDFSLQ